MFSSNDIRKNGYHMETINVDNMKYLPLFRAKASIRKIYTIIQIIGRKLCDQQKFIDPKAFTLWCDM